MFISSKSYFGGIPQKLTLSLTIFIKIGFKLSLFVPKYFLNIQVKCKEIQTQNLF